MLNRSEYLHILDLTGDPDPIEIKRAYRVKAREYHPDINREEGAREKFILAAEAYEYLLASAKRQKQKEEEYKQFMDDWQRYRQQRARYRASVYSSTSYRRFVKTKFYRTTNVYEGSRIVFALIIAVGIIIYSVAGYVFRLRHPIPGEEPLSAIALAGFIFLGLIFTLISLVFLKVFRENKRKNEKNNKSFQQ
jgi:membrane-associated protease RseP (regulator of RpoE activity)